DSMPGLVDGVGRFGGGGGDGNQVLVSEAVMHRGSAQALINDIVAEDFGQGGGAFHFVADFVRSCRGGFLEPQRSSGTQGQEFLLGLVGGPDDPFQGAGGRRWEVRV